MFSCLTLLILGVAAVSDPNAYDVVVCGGNSAAVIAAVQAKQMGKTVVIVSPDQRLGGLTSGGLGWTDTGNQGNVAVDAEGRACARNEGDIQVNPGGPYPIDYGALLPKPSECANLLVPARVSASHIAFGSIRMEPVFMILDQSAATAAAPAIDLGVPVQEVPYPALADRLKADGQVLEFASDQGAGRMDPRMLDGTVVTHLSADRIGPWTESSAIGNLVTLHYLHDNNQNKGACEIRFDAELPEPGDYEVRVSYTPNPNRASNVPVTVYHMLGIDTVRINQQLQPNLNETFVSVGVFSFERRARVVISNSDTTGYVIADAIQFIRAR